MNPLAHSVHCLCQRVAAKRIPDLDPEAPTLDRVSDFFATLHPDAPLLTQAFLTFYPKFLQFSGRSAYPRSINWRSVARSYFEEHMPKRLAQGKVLPSAELPISDTAFATLMASLPKPDLPPTAVPAITNPRQPPACAPATTDPLNCSQENAPRCSCESKDSSPAGNAEETTSLTHVTSQAESASLTAS